MTIVQPPARDIRLAASVDRSIRLISKGSAAGSTFVHCPAATSVFSANAPIPNAGDSSVPSVNVIFWVALWVAKQYCGCPLAHARQSPHTARQFNTT